MTLAKVREVWTSYATASSGQSKAEFERARQAKEARGGNASVITAARSAPPFTLDASALFQQYWDTGTTDASDAAPIANPMSSRQMDNLSLHYGTDPILGFHLATACAPLVDSSPLNPTQTDVHGLKPAVKASRQQFEAWCSAFRSRSRQLTLRFFVGEALTLCHALQQNLTAADDAAHWYRAPYRPDPLILDSHDCTSAQAPLTFNVVDTSNLIDHFGSINLLVAAAPLLDNGLAANLVTESLLRRYDSNQPPMDCLLCGNFNALSIVLGLFPVQHGTNTSSTSPLYESILTVFSSDFGKDTATQLHSRLTWKNHIPADTLGNVILHCSEEDLARLLYQTYLTMFEGEDSNVLTAKRNARHVRNISMPYYTRASYVAFLRFVKARVESDWSKVFAMLLNFIDNDTNLMLGRNFLQELRVQMHLFGVSAGLIPDVSLDERARTHREAAQLEPPAKPCKCNVESPTVKAPCLQRGSPRTARNSTSELSRRHANRTVNLCGNSPDVRNREMLRSKEYRKFHAGYSAG